MNNTTIHYKDMIKNKVLDEWLDFEEEEPSKKDEDDEELGDYDLENYD
jgi:hypothetical protein